MKKILDQLYCSPIFLLFSLLFPQASESAILHGHRTEFAGAVPLMVAQHSTFHILSPKCMASDQLFHMTATCIREEMPKEHLLKAV